MRTQILLLSFSAALTAAGCQQLECAEGTIERDGKCEPSISDVGTATCGPFTKLEGDRCVPQFPPTECDPGSTKIDVDPATGVATCIGTGTVSCTSPFPCSAPSGATKQTICGQLYDFRDSTVKLQGAATGAQCDPDAPTATGPCALSITAYDAVDFADGGTAPSPLTIGDLYIDDCGRYRLTDVDVSPVSLYVGLGVDDAKMPLGPAGITVTTAVATPRSPGNATKDLEAFMLSAATATGWASGGPNFGTTGLYGLVFRQHKLGNGDPFANQTGVTITKQGNPVAANDFYFAPAATDRVTIDTNATATGANGTGLVNMASVTDSAVWGGNNGLGNGCRWEPHAGATLMGIVFIQVFRKLDIVGQTCMD